MSTTDWLRAEDAQFLRERDLARAAADHMISSGEGPWPYGQFTRAIIEETGVQRGAARFVEDELIEQHVLVPEDGQFHVPDDASSSGS